MTNVYSVNLKVCATAYIKASNSGEAMEIARKLNRRAILTDERDSDIPVSGLDYDDAKLPDVSVSPAMTIHGVWSDIEEKEATMDLVHLGEPTKAVA